MEIITSVDNNYIKEVRSLQEKKYRRKLGKYLVEGPKFVREAVLGGGNVDKIFVLSSKIGEYIDIIDKKKTNVYAVNERVFSKMTDTENSQGILASVFMKEVIDFKPEGDILVLDRIADPGNMGTIIRTAAATGYTDIVAIDCVDVYGPKVVRSSAGGIFYTNIYPLFEDELLEFVKKHNYNLIIADARGENIFKMENIKPPSALVIGNEANGPSDNLKKAANTIVSLPMKEQVESLNAGVSASVLMYLIKKDNI